MPSLSVGDEAVELFVDRARLARPDFSATEGQPRLRKFVDGSTVCAGDEAAAARVRALSVDEIRDSLHDRFRLLTGTARMAVRRQQTLRASVDWSHALLTESERVYFADWQYSSVALISRPHERLPVVATSNATSCSIRSRCSSTSHWWWPRVQAVQRDTGCWRRSVSTPWRNSPNRVTATGSAGDRDHYLKIAGLLKNPAEASDEQRIERVKAEIDNLRAAFNWCLDSGDIDTALRFASALVPLWLAHRRIHEALMGWFDAAFSELTAIAVT